MEVLLTELRQSLSNDCKVLTQDDAEYETAGKRWSNLDVKRPGAIVQPACEDDIVHIVRKTIAAGIPFVPSSGGHSPWSTIDDNGIVIDLQLFKNIVVDAEHNTVKVQGGVVMKELQRALSEQGQFTTVANGNTVGVIPFALGGGINSYSPLIGYACENILAARMLTAAGEVVEASEIQNTDLLWAIRGAGQFMGFILELTLQTYDLSVIGPDGIRQIGIVIFPVEKAGLVCESLAQIVAKNDHTSAGHCMITCDTQGQGSRIVMVAPQYFGTESEFRATFKPLLDHEPVMFQCMPCSFEAHSDHLTMFVAPGDYKRFSQTGLASLDANKFSRLADLHKELIENLPGTERSSFTLEWHVGNAIAGARKASTSFGFKEIDIWLNVFTWYEDASIHDKVLDYDRRAQAIMRSDAVPEAYIAYTNTSREDPIEQRYKGQTTIETLRKLKRRWDPDGVFTKELL